MEIIPQSFKRGDSIEAFDGHLIGGIGGFSRACVEGNVLKEALEVVLVEGNPKDGFHARLGDSHHRLYEGRLTQSEVSFTLESFRTDQGGDILKRITKDSRTFRFNPRGSLRDFILENAGRETVRGALLHVRGIANELHVYGHKDPKKLNDETKTFDHPKGPVGIEGWGNLSFVENRTPFVHVHGTYEAYRHKKCGHFIMDDKTYLMLEKAELIVYPVASLVRAIQDEDFPTWKIG